LISLACATTCVLAAGEARAEGAPEPDLAATPEVAPLPPLPPVDLTSRDLTTHDDTAPVMDDDDGDDDSDLELEDVADPPAGKPAAKPDAKADAKPVPKPDAKAPEARPRLHPRHPRHPKRPPRTARRRPMPNPFARPHHPPRVFVLPPRHRPIAQPYTLVFPGRHRGAHHSPPPPPNSDQPATTAGDHRDDQRVRGGLLLSAGGTRCYGVAPQGGIMAGAKLHAAIPLPTLPGAAPGSRWLSSATIGLAGGFDVGTSGGVDAQLWRAGLVLAMGAPWTRDFLGVAIEGGVLGGHYTDTNDMAFSQRRQAIVQGPHGEGIDPKPYGLARLTFQVPLKNDVRPFLAGELGMTERTDDRIAGITGIHAGVVWNAW